MPRPRKAAELIQLFEGLDAPLYALDDRRQIIYLNVACAELLGVAPGDLVGRTCHYRSGDAEPLGKAADSLCPPPEVFLGQSASGEIQLAETGGGLAQRFAQFTPLLNADGIVAGVLARIAPIDSPSEGQSLVAPDSAAEESRRLHDAIQRMRAELDIRFSIERLIGVSPAMQRVRAQVDMAASSASAVLIVGPSGSGKEHIARAIHAASGSPSDSVATPVSCKSLPTELLLSTVEALITRQKSAAALKRVTLLLTDIQDLPVEAQSDIARQLTAAPPSVRIISTSTERVETLVESNRLNRELAMRLSTLTIELPPLAARREDIPLIAQLLLEDCNAANPDKQLRGFATDALDRLVTIDWPGQIDELAATVKAAYNAAESFEVALADLPKRVGHAADANRYQRKTIEPIQLEKFLAQIEAKLIGRALQQAKGNKSRAAKLLGLTRPRLYRRMVQLGLEGVPPRERSKPRPPAKPRRSVKPRPPEIDQPPPTTTPAAIDSDEPIPLTLDDDWGEVDWNEAETD